MKNKSVINTPRYSAALLSTSGNRARNTLSQLTANQEESMRGGRQATQVAQSRHTPQHPEILYGMGRTSSSSCYPRKRGGRCRIRSTP